MDSVSLVLEPTHDQEVKTTNPRKPQSHLQSAPWSNVPGLKIVDVEHPFLIKNIHKAMETLGGHRNISAIVAPESRDGPVGLYLRPEDRMSKAIMSHNVVTRNVVLQITVPKRTGRRRKKGSTGPFLDPAKVIDQRFKGLKDSRGQESPQMKLDYSTKRLLRSLQDNKHSYKAKPVGVIDQTHRFRGMPDFVYSTTNSPFITKFRENILPFHYDKIKQFAFDASKGIKPNTDLIPPPSFSHVSIPFIYSYRQNPAVKQTVNSAGHLTTTNTQTAPKVSTILVSYDVGTVPTTPPSHLPPFATLDPPLQRTIVQLRTLLASRPIWTRRAISNNIPTKEYTQTLRQAFQYVSYMFRSGPWRDAVVSLGIDPRTHPKYRIYQTLMFQMFTRDPTDPGPSTAPTTTTTTTTTTGNTNGHPPKRQADDRPRPPKPPKPQPPNKTSHIFNGTYADMAGKVWQVCDITDPQLRTILATPSLRAACDIRRDGWFQNGTWAKAKVIMKAKLTQIRDGEVPVDEDYARLLDIPDVLDASNRRAAVLLGSRREVQWAADIRTLAASPATRIALGGREGRTSRRTSVLSRDVEVEEVGAETGGGSRVVDMRVADSMREMERSGLGLEVDDGLGMEGEDVMDGEDVDAQVDEEAMDLGEEMGE